MREERNVPSRWFPVQRVVSLLFVLATAAFLLACNQSQEAEPTPTQPAIGSGTTPTAVATPEEHEEHETAIQDDADLVATLYEMLGHLEASRANLEQGNWTLAQAHAAHPTAEYWASVESVLEERGLTSVREPLDAYLQAAQEESADARQANEAAQQALREAIATVLESSDDPSALQAAALATLAESIATELAEAVENGQIVNIEEFQDAWGFFQVLRNELPTVVAAAPESGKEAAAEAEEDLEALENSDLAQFRDEAGAEFTDTETIRERLQHLAAELRLAYGISAPQATSTGEQIARINAMLDEALELYRQGDADAAYEQAANAYLDGFEHLEAPLLDAGHRELVEQLELDFKAVRDAIREGRSVDEVSQLIEKVKSGLAEVEEVLQ